MELTDAQIERYSRNIAMDQVGLAGQEKLLAAKVLVIGAGGLGSPAILYLAAAGVGTIGIVDADVVDVSNLQRQIIHGTDDLGRDKVCSAAEKVRSLNPEVNVRACKRLLCAGNISEMICDYDFVIDGTDNFQAKFLINDACYFSRKPYSHVGVLRFIGQAMTVLPGRSACLRCLFEGPPPAGSYTPPARAGVLGALAGTMGCLQAAEAIKFILGQGDLLTNAAFTCDLLHMTFRKVVVPRNPRCRLCGETPTITSLRDDDGQDGPVVCARD